MVQALMQIDTMV